MAIVDYSGRNYTMQAMYGTSYTLTGMAVEFEQQLFEKVSPLLWKINSNLQNKFLLNDLAKLLDNEIAFKLEKIDEDHFVKFKDESEEARMVFLLSK